MEQPRILIVEDEEAILFAMDRYLRTRGYTVDCAQDVSAARDLLAANAYKIVIADLRLSGVHGAEGLDVMAYARECNPNTKMILLTAYGSAELEDEARRCGAFTVLRKPIPLPDIAQVLCVMDTVSPEGA